MMELLIVFTMSFSAITAIVAWVLRFIQVVSGETDESEGRFGKYFRIMLMTTFLSFGLTVLFIWIYSLILKH